MPVDTYYLDGRSDVVVTDYHGAWDWEQLAEADEAVGELLDSVPHKAYVIGIFRDGSRLKDNPANARKFVGRSSFTEHPNLKHLYVINLPVGLRSIANIYNKVFAHSGRKVFTFNTLDEALAHLDSS